MSEGKDNRYVINTFRDMNQFGVNVLTGEACAYSLRYLCDVNEEGRQLLSDFFSISELKLNFKWNPTVDGKPSVGSIMLTKETLNSLVKFALFHVAKVDYFAELGSSIYGYNEEDVPLDTIDRSGATVRLNISKRSKHPQSGGRNVHTASDRID